MALLSALLSYLLRQIGKVLQAVFGWSVTALFGRLSSSKQTAVSVALLLSVVWPVFIVGLVFPGAAAWIIAFLPLEKWMSPTVLRVIWCVLAVITPAIVGLVTRWVAPSKKGGPLNAMVHGYPLALGYAFAFLVTVVTVPIVKIASLMRRWTDQHVYVQARPGRYQHVLHELGEACVAAGIVPEVADVPTSMALSTKVIRALARGAVSPLVQEDPKMLRAENLEIYLYPADLLIRGEKTKAAHVRAMMTRTNLERDAYLVTTPEAQKIQDELCKLWESGLGGKARLRELRGAIDHADIPFEDWTILENVLHHAERALAQPKERPAMAQTTTEKSTADLVREAVDEAKQLVRIEVELAKHEAKKEVREIEGAAAAFGGAAASLVVCLAMIALAIVIAAGATVSAALIVAACFFVVAGILAAIGYALIPKKPLERTRERATTEVRQLKEHTA